MILYPAIDIRGGRCVRLIEGDFARETVFDADPVEAARRWVAAGAEWLHVVDLDGAVTGEPANQEAVARIRAAVDVSMQLGGGLRGVEQIERVLTMGIDRVVLGTAAARDSALVRAALARWGDRVAAGLDARDGRLATRGWLGQTDIPVLQAAERLASDGIRHLIYTDIQRDGTLSGPNIVGLQALVTAVPASVIVSGGVGSLDDLVAIKRTGAGGAIIGRALYDGRLDLREAIAAMREGEAV